MVVNLNTPSAIMVLKISANKIYGITDTKAVTNILVNPPILKYCLV
jgi:hypothetical protein